MYTIFAICLTLLGRMSNAVPMDLSPVDPKDQVTLRDSLQTGPVDVFSYIETHDVDPMTDENLSQAISSDSAPAIDKNELETEDLSQYFESRIVGGNEAKPNYNPAMVALIIGWVFPSFMCGGSIITKKHILTAAHCIVYDWDENVLESFHGRVGSNTWNDGGKIVTFKCHKNHPEYDFFDIKNDVGVLYLEQSLKFSESVSPIRLNDKWVDGEVSVHVTGWGRKSLGGLLPNDLQILYLWTLSPTECQKKWSEIANAWSPVVDPKQEICTFHSRGHGMCHGDSGSALICTKINKLCGVVSWGFPCAVNGPDVFARISYFIKFLESAIKEQCSKK